MQGKTAVRVLARDPVLLAVVAVVAAMACWQVPGHGSPVAGAMVAPLPSVLFDLVIFDAARRLARQGGTTAAARRFWWALAVMAVLFGVGDAGQIVHVWGRPGSTDPTLSDWLAAWTLAALAVPVLVMLTYPQVSPSRQARIRFWLDASAVLSAAVVITWVVAGRSPVSAIPETAVSLIAAFAATRMLLSGAAPMSAIAATPALVSAGLQGLSGVLSADPAGNRPLLLTLQVAAPALLSMGLRAQLVLARHAVAQGTRRARPYSLLPYAMLAAVFGVVPVALRADGTAPATVAVTGLAVVTGLVVARQLVVFGEFDSVVARLDVSLREARELEDRLRYQTLHDPLTGLANRALFGDRLALAAPTGAAVLNIDLDGFKTINDTYGHHAGDAVLVEVAARLRASVPADGLAARLGGDEFAVLLPGTDRAPADAVAHRFRDLLHLSITVDGRLLHVGASVGTVTGVTGDPEELLRRADEEMYRVKHDGRRPAPMAQRTGRGTATRSEAR